MFDIFSANILYCMSGLGFFLVLAYFIGFFSNYIPHFLFLTYSLLPLFYKMTGLSNIPLTTIFVLIFGPVVLWKSRPPSLIKLWPIFCYFFVVIFTSWLNQKNIVDLRSAFISPVIAMLCFLSFSNHDTENNIKNFAYLIIGWGIMNAFFSILQFIFGDFFYVVSVTEEHQVGGLQRGYGLVGMATELGLVFTVVVPLFGSVLLAHKRSFLLLVLFVINFVGLVLTFSRGAILGSYISFFLLLFLLRKRMVLKLYVVSTVILVFCYLTIISTLPDDYSKHFKAQDGSAAARLPYVQLALKMFADKPLVGFGAGGFYDNCTKYGSRINVEAHNTYIQVLVDYGAIGFICFLYCIYRSLKGYVKYLQHGPSEALRVITAGFFCGLLAVLLSAFVHCFEWKMFFWLPILLGFLMDFLSIKMGGGFNSEVQFLREGQSLGIQGN